MKNWFAQNWYKIVATLLLLIALGDLEYGYYQLLRWLITGASAYSAFWAYGNGSKSWMWLFVVLAILFNPVAPIHLEKSTWQVIDLITAVIFAVSSFSRKFQNRSNISDKDSQDIT